MAGLDNSGLTAAPSVDVEHLDPKFADKLVDFTQDAKDAGIDNQIISGYRDNEKQGKLFKNYLAGLQHKDLPFPELGPVPLAAVPGTSMHNVGKAADIVATDPGRQNQLIAMVNDPHGIWNDRGIKALGASDPAHFEDSQGGMATIAKAPNAIAPATLAAPTSGSAPVAASTPTATVAAKPADQLSSLRLMLALRNLYPNHAFTPVDYDPYKVMPKL